MIRFIALPTDTARALRGRPDAYGNPPEPRVAAPGDTIPCRHCLRPVAPGRGYVVLAHRPFAGLNPYTETGPIFLCAEDCPRGGGTALPAVLSAPHYITRAYGRDERIRYGTGAVTPTPDIAARCAALLVAPETAFVHIRSATNNCFFCRVERG